MDKYITIYKRSNIFIERTLSVFCEYKKENCPTGNKGGLLVVIMYNRMAVLINEEIRYTSYA